MKYLKKFNTETEYLEYVQSTELVRPNVSLIGTNTRDVRYIQVQEAGMVCYYDGSKFKLCAPEEWKSSLGELQGIVVVPSTHTSDGTVRIMCIKGVNTDGSQATGNVDMDWGPTGDTGLPNMDKVPTWDNTISGSTGINSWGRLPSNSNNGNFTGATCTTDIVTKYYNASEFIIPSPYLTNGQQNPHYLTTESGLTANALSDFNGKSNTEVLAGLGSAYTAAYACHLYGTTALPAGNWYLPACGELGYIMPRFNEIQSALQTVGGVQLISGNRYWSSTEYSSSNARYVHTGDGDVGYYNKALHYFVRAFASVPVSRLGF